MYVFMYMCVLTMPYTYVFKVVRRKWFYCTCVVCTRTFIFEFKLTNRNMYMYSYRHTNTDILGDIGSIHVSTGNASLAHVFTVILNVYKFLFLLVLFFHSFLFWLAKTIDRGWLFINAFVDVLKTDSMFVKNILKVKVF